MEHIRKITVESLNINTKVANDRTFLLFNNKCVCKFSNINILDIELDIKIFKLHNDIVNNVIMNFLDISSYEELENYIKFKIIKLAEFN